MSRAARLCFIEDAEGSFAVGVPRARIGSSIREHARGAPGNIGMRIEPPREREGEREREKERDTKNRLRAASNEPPRDNSLRAD